MTTNLERIYAVLFGNPYPADDLLLSICNNLPKYVGTDSVKLRQVHDQLQDVRNFLEHSIKKEKESDDAQ